MFRKDVMWTSQSQHEGLRWNFHLRFGGFSMSPRVGTSLPGLRLLQGEPWPVICIVKDRMHSRTPWPGQSEGGIQNWWKIQAPRAPDREIWSQKQICSEGFTALCGLLTFCLKLLQKWLQPYMWVWSCAVLELHKCTVYMKTQRKSVSCAFCLLWRAFLLSDSLQSTYLTWMNNIRRLRTFGWFEY